MRACKPIPLSDKVRDEFESLIVDMRCYAATRMRARRLRITADRIQDCLLAACVGASKWTPDMVGGCALKTRVFQSIEWRVLDMLTKEVNSHKHPSIVGLFRDFGAIEDFLLFDSLEKLPNDERQIFCMVHGIDQENALSLREIARRTGVSEATTRRRYHAACERFLEYLQADNGS